MSSEKKTAKRKRRSRAGEIWHRLRKNKGAMAGLFIIALLALTALSANWILDYDKQVIGQNIAERLQAPSSSHWMGTDELGRDIFAVCCMAPAFHWLWELWRWRSPWLWE